MTTITAALAALAALALLAGLPPPAAAQPERRFGPEVLPTDPATPPFTTTTTTKSQPAGITALPECRRRATRTLDGTCTSVVDKELGATERPFFTYVRPPRDARPTPPPGLPSARAVSNALAAGAPAVASRRGLSELPAFFAQLLAHGSAAAPVAAGARLDIALPPGDPARARFPAGALPFERAVLQRVSARAARPLNAAPSAIGLAAVYGPSRARLARLRTFSGGRLATSPGGLLPLNTARLPNQPPGSGARFFVAGDRRANENPALGALHALFAREHNRLAGALRREFPTLNDELLFGAARRVNGALFQKIVYEEFLPAVLGARLPRYRGYRPDADPTVSDEFATAAFQLDLTMLADRVARRGPGNAALPPVRAKDMFYAPASLLTADGIEPYLRGAAYERAQEVDTVVSDAWRNMLFANVPGVLGFDALAETIQRGRDHALPSYNDLRALFGRRRAKSFTDISSDAGVQRRLRAAYGGRVDRVDAVVGLLAEGAAPGASVGDTMRRIWRREFGRLRDGDRLFYLRREAYPALLLRFSGIEEIFSGSGVMKKIILRNTNISARDLSGSVWKAKA